MVRDFKLNHFLLFTLILALLSGCTTAAPIAPTAQQTSAAATPAPLPPTEPPSAATAVPPATATPAPSPTATPSPMPTRASLGLELAPGAPQAAADALLAALAAAGKPASVVPSEADVQLAAQSREGAILAWERIFAPVDRLSSVLEGVTVAELRDVWTGAGATPNFTAIYPDQAIVADLEALLGPAGPAVKPQPAAGVADAVWADPLGLGLMPFEGLSVRLRALRVDGLASPTDNRFAADTWPLTARGWLLPLTPRGSRALDALAGQLPFVNRDPAKLTVLVMTGVTAMARNSAVAIERSGDYGFLARQVGPELAAADITIISNEIPFIPGCVANNTLNNLILCSKPEYFLNLELSGVDAVGLTGNHQNDFGYANMRASLAFYAERKIPVYGGGTNEKAARQPIVLIHNGNRLGFLGANQWGPEWYWSGTGEKVSAWAGPDYPGSARFDRAQMVADIQALAPQVDLVFAEVQHTEFNNAGDYQTEPIPSQEADFRAMSDAGAQVVTGVMAHAPQAVELREGRVILYGLGNLYFDQTWSWPTRTGLVARHTIYNGQLINTELLVTVIETNFQLRWATPEERIQVLRSVFDVSRW